MLTGTREGAAAARDRLGGDVGGDVGGDALGVGFGQAATVGVADLLGVEVDVWAVGDLGGLAAGEADAGHGSSWGPVVVRHDMHDEVAARTDTRITSSTTLRSSGPT